MKLYQIPSRKGAKIFCETSDGSEYVVFGHVDGMYSYCTTEKGAVVHLGAHTELKTVHGGYALV